MRAIGIKALKNRLSEFVRLAAGGETVLVLDRERVVAELVPPRAGRSIHPPDVLLAEAVREGFVSPPVGGGEPLPERNPVSPLSEVLRGLKADREDE